VKQAVHFRARQNGRVRWHAKEGNAVANLDVRINEPLEQTFDKASIGKPTSEASLATRSARRSSTLMVLGIAGPEVELRIAQVLRGCRPTPTDRLRPQWRSMAVPQDGEGWKTHARGWL
jgi:hypothetical protein